MHNNFSLIYTEMQKKLMYAKLTQEVFPSNDKFIFS
jgi:hypothetical protein